MRKVIVLLTGLAILAFVNLAIHQRETLLTEGKVVLLELAPVDPRSLMQGDYMALDFAAARVLRDQHQQRKLPRDGRIVLRLDERGVGSFQRIDQDAPLAPNEVVLRYRIRDQQPRFGTNAFFFQEGTADRYSAAKYGELRVAADGEAILTGLRGADLRNL